MQALQLAIFSSLLATFLSEDPPVSLAGPLEAEDACAPGATEEECEVSFRQLRGKRTIARHGARTAAGREQQNALVLGSSVNEGIGYKESWNFSIKEYEPGAKLYNSFEESRLEAKWEFQSAIISIEAQPQMFETVDDHRPLGLRLEFTSTLAGMLDAHAEIRVARIDDVTVPGALDDGKPSAVQMPFFRMAAPNCFGLPACFSRKPPGDFAKAPKPEFSAAKKAAEVLTFNLTSILDAEHTSLQVWVTPHNLTVDGLWKTEVYRIQNYRFFNLDDSFDETPPSDTVEDDDDDDWGYY